MQGVNWGIENSPQSGCEHAPDFPQAPSCSPFETAACTLLKKQPYLYVVKCDTNSSEKVMIAGRSCNTWSFCLYWFVAPHPGHKYFIEL